MEERIEMDVMFENLGNRGLLCFFPPDGGAPIVPRSYGHGVVPVEGCLYRVEITGEVARGRLRMARVLENLTATQEITLPEGGSSPLL